MLDYSMIASEHHRQYLLAEAEQDRLIEAAHQPARATSWVGPYLLGALGTWLWLGWLGGLPEALGRCIGVTVSRSA
jgi:hypothetical protein